MKFPKHLLRELIGEKFEIVPGEGVPSDFCGSYETLVNDIIDQGRWTVEYDFVFSFEKDMIKRHFRAPYRTGATECQDEMPWENEGEFVEAEEVEQYEVVTVGYRRKHNGA
ncbi:hypothetical protein PHG31p100 [Aeromonas phage 31]|uniref:Uncharacterized protein PHG31ORF102c n=1 Tax=Aeromonas phage 31 TaxID=321023 RepID=Q56ER1_9CAUD|nr:hypothetical protein PHG31p100 [Aeromonas phage 31]AAX63589.1 hypothetical protein PHG31p100 [Aeromonas phage 31]APU02402.1 hypothetical protein [Aeromonas phage SW69-9]